MDALEKMRALLRADGCTVRISGAREQWIYPASRRAIVIISADKGVLRLCAERIGDYAAKVPVSLRHIIVRTQLRRRLQTVGREKVRGRLAVYAGRVRVRQVLLQRIHVQHDKG